jgi:signal peptidase II
MRILFLTAVSALVIDQTTKFAVLYGLDLLSVGVIDVASPYLQFVMAWNRGVNFGILASDASFARWVLVAVSLVISIVLIFWARRQPGRWFQFGAGLVVGGAVGNAIDRARYGAVADFLNMSCCGINNPYVFNVADISIFAGAVLLILVSGKGTERGDEDSRLS